MTHDHDHGRGGGEGTRNLDICVYIYIHRFVAILWWGGLEACLSFLFGCGCAIVICDATLWECFLRLVFLAKQNFQVRPRHSLQFNAAMFRVLQPTVALVFVVLLDFALYGLLRALEWTFHVCCCHSGSM